MPEITLEAIGEKVTKIADAVAAQDEKLRALGEKVEGNIRSFDEYKTKNAPRPDGTFNVLTESGKLDPTNPKHVRENFSIARMVSAMYWDQVEYKHDRAWEQVPGKNGACFERDVIAIARANKAAAIGNAEPGALAAMAGMRGNGVQTGDGYRAQVTTTGSAGGYLVPSELGWFDDVLRNALVISAMGVQNVPTTGIPFYFNKKSTAATGAYIASETGTITSSDIAFQQVAAYPRVWGYYTPCSRRILKTASPDLNSIVKDDLMMNAAINRQTQLLKGTGTSGAPVGIANAGSGVTSTSQASTSLLTLAAAVSTVAKNNGIVNPQNIGWIVSPGFKAVVATLVGSVATGTAGAFMPLADPKSPWMYQAMPVHGAPMVATAALSSTDTSAEGIYGDWSMVKMIDWGQELIFSEHVLWTTQQVALGILDEHEFALRRTQSFTYWTNGEAL